MGTIPPSLPPSLPPSRQPPLGVLLPSSGYDDRPDLLEGRLPRAGSPDHVGGFRGRQLGSLTALAAAAVPAAQPGLGEVEGDVQAEGREAAGVAAAGLLGRKRKKKFSLAKDDQNRSCNTCCQIRD